MVNYRKAETTLMGTDVPWPSLGKHHCSILSEMDHGMHQQSPSAPLYQRLARVIRKLTLPTYAHRQCRHYYPSRTSMVAAWMRTSATKCPTIIHPFSVLALAWQMIMLLVWVYLSISRPLFMAYTKFEFEYYLAIHLSLTCSAVLLLNILVNFLTGYQEHQGKCYIVLDSYAICTNYLCHYFIFDVINAFPTATLLYTVSNIHRGWMLVHLVQFVRARTLITYALNIGHLLHLQTIYIHITCLVYFGVITVHWCTCVLIMTVRSTSAENTLDDYMVAMNKVLSHFFLGSTNTGTNDLIPHIVTLILGFIYRTIAIGMLLMYLVKYDRTSMQFNSFLRESEQYMRTNQVPLNLQLRIEQYIRHKYQGRKYRSYITSIMSEHLRHEIYLNYCSHLICTMQLCKHLKRATIGEMLMTLEPVFYHPGDIVFSVNDIGQNLYIISHGKIAAYTALGMEVAHLADGEIFGLIGFYQHQHVCTMVAIEPTEAFIWRRSKVDQLCARHEDLDKQLRTKFEQSNEQYMNLNRHRRFTKFTGPARIYMQLGDKRIVEERQLRFGTEEPQPPALHISTAEPTNNAAAFYNLMRLTATEKEISTRESTESVPPNSAKT
ncbi:potassium/sodium hyperpolarization-activated cyclic nucleotide-gated channel 3-like [Atheta coriaria]|uniref:potassium/sodium hyperpolarization-activated cyclic nucleotide-gated channel 3-like n=1 Tax=Dalotia coriaria TaxID=877792 RepID=UPI0031F3F9DC